MRRLRGAAVALVAAVALAGCGPAEGTVVQKDYRPAEWYWTTCYRSVPYYNGKTTSTRTVPYSCQQHRPASYSLYLREETGGAPGKHEPEAGWRSVGEQVYMACAEGEYYRDGKCS